jgi:hypothetical protein
MQYAQLHAMYNALGVCISHSAHLAGQQIAAARKLTVNRALAG